MKKQLRYALTAVLLTGLAGCGLKGPLYFPPNDKPAPQTTVPDTGKVERNQQEPVGTAQQPSMNDQ